ncbi:MAG: hypothetical protein AB1Z22_02080 [Synechococcaceae cyanobacterium]
MKDRLRSTLISAFTCVTILVLVTGCDEQIGGYLPASSISTRTGFARNRKQALKMSGKEIKLWGYVDYSNVYADGAGDAVPTDWDQVHSHNLTPDMWRFDLMIRPDGEAGCGFAVYLRKHEDGKKLFAGFSTNERAGKPSRVYVKGKVFTFDAPTNLMGLTGLYMESELPNGVLLEHPDTK